MDTKYCEQVINMILLWPRDKINEAAAKEDDSYLSKYKKSASIA